MAGPAKAGRPRIGLVEWFRPGEEGKVERVLDDLKAYSIQDLRFGFSWADYFAEGGVEWYDWLVPRLASEVEILPCFHYTPPSLGIVPACPSPPREPKAYADFLDVMITGLGMHFAWVELWNEPNNLSDWDWRLDPDWRIFCEMVGGAAFWARQRGKKTVLGGACPTDPNWLKLLGERGVIAQFDAVGIHGFPGTWEFDWTDWTRSVEEVRRVTEQYAPDAELWITEAGFSTWNYDERGQLQAFLRACEAPVSRMYWYSGYDLDPDLETQDGFHADERHYHMGLKRHDGSPKLLARLWEQGRLNALREVSRIETGRADERGRVLITGGAGFLGTSLAERLLCEGRSVLMFDILAGEGSETNYRRLRDAHGDRLSLQVADVRDRPAIRRALEGVDQVFHLAAHRPGKDSPPDPLLEFDINARGTLNLLEEIRRLDSPPALVHVSSGIVYRQPRDFLASPDTQRDEPADWETRRHGINEDHPLGFAGSDACSVGVAESYVLDYARRYRIPSVVLRLGAVYSAGPVVDRDPDGLQRFYLEMLQGEPVTIRGEGEEVQDFLFIDDMVDALLSAQGQMARLSGGVFNVGGGPENAIARGELIDRIALLLGTVPTLRWEDALPEARRYLVLDTRRFRSETGWAPRVTLSEGLATLCRHLAPSRVELKAVEEVS